MHIDRRKTTRFSKKGTMFAYYEVKLINVHNRGAV